MAKPVDPKVFEEHDIWVRSTLDGSLQPSLFFRSEEEGKRPLLVGLHTWSHNRQNQINNMLPHAKKNGFHLLLPEFRGQNRLNNPACRDACGSELARQDIRDAIDHVIKTENVDTDNVFLLGSSGGGHMALLMAGKCPEIFRAVGAFVPITDLSKWVDQNANYRKHVIGCCGEDKEEMLRRSPVTYLDTIATANLKIFHGKHDPVVPVSQSLEFFAQMMEKHPKAKVYLDIFDGGHQMIMKQAMFWFLSQYKQVEMEEVTG